MTNSSKIVLERIDHGVLPSNDLGRAFRFWSGFMGGQVGHHTNFNARGLIHEVATEIAYLSGVKPVTGSKIMQNGTLEQHARLREIIHEAHQHIVHGKGKDDI